MRRPLLLATCLLVCLGCDDAGGEDAGPGTDAGPQPDAGTATDAGPRTDAGPGTDAGGTDAGPPPAPEGWAPQPWEDCEGGGRTLEAGPSDYRDVLSTLAAGDTLRLQPGTYTRGLPLRTSGADGQCIVIEPLDLNDRPRFEGSDAFNIVAVHGASWIKVRGLDIDGLGRAGFGVASQGGTDQPTHHIVIEDLTMVGLGANQQITGVSTKSPAWDWVIRGNRITGAGTGMYLGNSDGNQPFIRGVVELNTVRDTIGYNLQIKHQNPRPALDGIPGDGSETLIRWNVFSKQSGASSGGSARPNLLLGHYPTSGPGQNDRTLVYGNFLYDNPTENLMQAEGNVAVYNNVFVNPNGGALNIQPHNDVPRVTDVFWNTIVANGRGIRVTGGDSAFAQRVRYNAVFSPMPISADDESGNVTGGISAPEVVDATSAPGAGLDLHPAGTALEMSVDVGELPDVPFRMRDFEGRERMGAFVGAYAGAGGGALVLEARLYGE
ncbi:MAG: hypothetical protein AB8I08_18560 [Sandaracinaceae bacterium]